MSKVPGPGLPTHTSTSPRPPPPRVYVEAARVTVMGGHVGFGQFESGTLQRYYALLDKAIALDAWMPKRTC